MGLDMYLQKTTRDDAKELFYWRKANAIHAFFCKAGVLAPNGRANVGYYKIDKKTLIELQSRCKKVIKIFKSGKKTKKEFVVGYRYVGGVSSPVKEEIEIMGQTETDEIEKILPTQSGFFFGSTEYSEWYFQQIEDTKEFLDGYIPQMDDSDVLYYYASW